MKLISSLAFMMMTIFAFGQKASVKVNLFSLAVQNISPRAEFALNDNMSVEVSLGLFIPRNANALNDALDFESSDGKFTVNPEFKFTGFSFTPSFRYYFGQKGPMEGFYISPYLQYYNYKIGSTTSYDGDVIDLDFINWGFGGGLGIGYQWVLNNGFTIDWFVIGGGAAYNKISSRFTPAEGTDLDQLKEDAITEFEHWVVDNGGEEIEIPDDVITLNNDRLQFGFPFTLPIGRIGFSLGYAF